MRRVLIVRLGALGDLVHTLPAVAAVHRAWPDAEIDWLVEPKHRELLTLVPLLARVIAVHDRSVRGWLATVRELRARHYDAAIDFQGLIKSAALARWSGAARVIGFDRTALREPAARLFYSEQPSVGEGRHVVFKNVALADAAVGGRVSSGPLSFPLEVPASRAWQTLKDRGVGRYALINPGAAWPNKRWPPARFGAVAAHVRDAHALTPVVLWGPHEQSLAQAVVDASRGAAMLAPETQLADLVALARAASLMVSGDTGPLHIAGAAGTPIVSLFGPTDPHRNGPWAPADMAISRYDHCACSYKRRCLQPASWCLETISTETVVRAVDDRLAGASGTHS